MTTAERIRAKMATLAEEALQRDYEDAKVLYENTVLPKIEVESDHQISNLCYYVPIGYSMKALAKILADEGFECILNEDLNTVSISW